MQGFDESVTHNVTSHKTCSRLSELGSLLGLSNFDPFREVIVLLYVLKIEELSYPKQQTVK